MKLQYYYIQVFCQLNIPLLKWMKVMLKIILKGPLLMKIIPQSLQAIVGEIKTSRSSIRGERHV
jgi:hypothetical protein